MNRFIGVFCVYFIFVGFVNAEDSVNKNIVNAPNYYRIGGPSQTLSRPPGGVPLISRRLTTDVDFNYQCGDFDVIEDIERRFEQFADGLDNAADVMTAYIEGRVANLPIYVMQRWFPGAYETAQEFFDRYWAEYQIHLESCQATQTRILNNQGGLFEGYSVWAKAGTWQGGINSGKTASETAEDVQNNSGIDGAMWVNGEKAGGLNQEPARYVADLCKLGWRMFTEQDDEAYIKTFFETEADIEAWCTTVLGEIEISLVENPQNTPGLGLWALSSQRAGELQEIINRLVYDTRSEAEANLDYEELYALTRGGLPLEKTVIDAAIAKGKQNPEIRMRLGYLARQAATMNELQRSMQVIRVLRSAAMDPVVVASGASDAVSTLLVPQLEEEIRLSQQMIATSTAMSESIHENIIAAPEKESAGRINQNRAINSSKDGDIGGAGGDFLRGLFEK